MYVTSPHGHVFALDAATGELKWTYNPEMPPLTEVAICCGQTNRGPAVGDGKVFVGLVDVTLVALDAETGGEGLVEIRGVFARRQKRLGEDVSPSKEGEVA